MSSMDRRSSESEERSLHDKGDELLLSESYQHTHMLSLSHTLTKLNTLICTQLNIHVHSPFIFCSQTPQS